MEDYHFWQDFFDTYQSLSNGTKALWLIVPPAFVLGLVALILRHRVALRKVETSMRGDLVYTIHRDGDDKLHVYRHGAALEREPALVLLDQPNSDRFFSRDEKPTGNSGRRSTPRQDETKRDPSPNDTTSSRQPQGPSWFRPKMRAKQA